jgi:hypothetical protein
VDYAHVLKDLADIHFSAAQTIVVVQDNLIHSKGSLRSLPGRRSPAAGRAVRMALHAQARQLAQSGGVGTRRSIVPVSGRRIPINKPSPTRSPLGNMTATRIILRVWTQLTQ